MTLPKDVELGVVPQKRTMSRGTAGASHVFRELYAAVNINFFKIVLYFFVLGGSPHNNIIFIWNSFLDNSVNGDTYSF